MAPASVFIFGLIVGSFLNVCIYRLPRNESVITPRSACPACGHKIAFYDNIPLVSYLVLLGRCRHCGASISWRYPLVELLNAVLWLLVWNWLGLTPGLFLYAAFCSAMLVLAIIDAEHRILPHGITFGGMALAFATVPWQDLHFSQTQQALATKVIGLAGLHWESPLALAWLDAFLGFLAGAGLLLVVAVGYYLLKKQEGMGHGDIVMMGFVGAVLGPQLAFLTILLGSFLGAVVGLVLIQLTDNPRYQIPFGTFLGGAAVVSMFVGHEILAWYWQLT